MICSECKEAGIKSTVRMGPSISTCMSVSQYWDEDGGYHFHDPNTTTTTYTCSNGHQWSESRTPTCKTCEKRSRQITNGDT